MAVKLSLKKKKKIAFFQTGWVYLASLNLTNVSRFSWSWFLKGWVVQSCSNIGKLEVRNESLEANSVIFVDELMHGCPKTLSVKMFLNKKEKPGLKFNQLGQGLYPKSDRERKIYALHNTFITWKEVSRCKSRSRRERMYQTVCSKCLMLLNVHRDGLVAVVIVVLSFQCLNIVVGEIATL